MDLLVYDTNRQLMGVVEEYEYLRWTRRYSRSGGYELRAMATPNALNLLKIGHFLGKSDDEEIGLIEFAEISMEDREIIEISGKFGTGLLWRRIVLETEILNGDLGAALGQLLGNNILPTAPVAARRIPYLSYQQAVLGVNVENQVSYRNLLSVVEGLCAAGDVGIRTIFNNGNFIVTPYIGTDASGVFSREFENIINQTFTVSVRDFATFALVGGEGEGSERTFVQVGGGWGEWRFEVFVDARDLQSENFPTGYEDALAYRGMARLAELALVEAFDATINQFGNLQYKVDYDIGSRVRIVAKQWGMEITARITELEENYDRDGMGIRATFGKPLLTIYDKINDLGGA
jgi:hypothetical protein